MVKDEEREKRRIYMQGWRERNRERHNELARQSHQRNKHKHVGKVREYHLRRSYGISSDDYAKMLLDQDSRCLICNKHQDDEPRAFHVDHSHDTGEVRGLLCGRCNTSLGWFEKNKDRVISYL